MDEIIRKCVFSCSKFTVQLDIDEEDVIVKAAPIVRKFIGQELTNLEDWVLNRFGVYFIEWI